ncbi:U4/U6-U5 snRNP complex subunit lsm6 [Coccidioides posadasii str. Silveira]|uniref:Uncharacterized protein n=1 Tax=Coccidioides posadasii (strain RMSCC 757 / Silveira) TaxID=443226 RepID=E9CR63_COCPS|nr:hypothetical protein CPSG_01094 [Coccidioides posadasii str. Silveira]QVM12068.1 U4/U6-U5 snRNP complex subunit lsm6 [Coccidioides posadasii str. Silveira]
MGKGGADVTSRTELNRGLISQTCSRAKNYAPPSLFAYSSSIRSSYRRSASSLLSCPSVPVPCSDMPVAEEAVHWVDCWESDEEELLREADCLSPESSAGAGLSWIGMVGGFVVMDLGSLRGEMGLRQGRQVF